MPAEVPVNIAEHRGRVVVSAPLPGCNAHDIQVELEGRRLTIEGAVMGGQNMKYLRREWQPGGYRRVVEVPAEVTASGASAHYGNGILVIHLPVGDSDVAAGPIVVGGPGSPG